MGLLDISLTSSMRTTLFSLKDTSSKIERAQERLASGKKVMSALDNPTNYFAAQAALHRAGDLTSRKDGIMEAIKNGDAANVGLKSLVSLLDTAKGIANSAHMAGASERTSLASQFNQILSQMDSLAGDSGYRGTNLLKNDDLTVSFNENGSSNLTINGVDATSSGLGIERTTEETGTVIAAGGGQSLAVTEDGSVVGWGSTLGTNIPLSASTDVIGVSAGWSHSLALKSDGTVVAWGDNTSGQTDVPASIQGSVAEISTSWYHSLALTADGSVSAWGGDNFDGELNVPVSAQSGVVAVAAGGNFSLALKSDGSVVAWGSNNYGQSSVPLAAQSGVVAIAASGALSLALKDDGSVIAWGRNNSGQTTVPLAAQSGVIAIAAGAEHALALKNDGTIVAWGNNIYGQTTVPLAAQSGVTTIAAGYTHSLALLNSGAVVAWGENSAGQTTVPATALSGIGSPDYSWQTDAGISKSEQQLENALSTLRTDAQTLSSNLSVIGIRKEFTDSMVANLQTGADNLTLADMNEESANMLMLQTRQNLGVTSLSMASQSAGAVMKLF